MNGRCIVSRLTCLVVVLLVWMPEATAQAQIKADAAARTAVFLHHPRAEGGIQPARALGFQLWVESARRLAVENAFCDKRGDASLDVAGLAAVYCVESRIVRSGLNAAHETSYPVFYTAVPAAWVGAWAQGDGDYTDAYRLTVTQGVTYVAVVGLKRLVGRPRPYVTQPLTSRSKKYGDHIEDGAYASMPSGHASLSTALAVSWSLSHPRWYVVAPSALWAGTVTVSRLFLGVHYPSDVLAGAVLGMAVAVGVHLLRDAITPDAFYPDDPEMNPPGALANSTAPAVTLRFPLP